jgi:DNA-binding NarL/FixJ family response regulator
MTASSSYSAKSVLLLGRLCEDLHAIETLLNQLQCRVTKLQSAEQIGSHLEQQLQSAPPCLVILASSDYQWAEYSALQLRQLTDQSPITSPITLVALSDRNTASTLIQPGENSAIDGYLVTPLSRAVLSTLLQSASVRQRYITSDSYSA